MYRDSYFDKIISIIKRQPMSQGEIYRRLWGKISLQGIANHLNRGVKEGIILYLGNKVNKKDARYFLKHKFDRLWPFNAHQCYAYTPQTEKFYLRLKQIPNANDEKISEIIKLYRELEFAAMFYELEYYNFKIVRKYKKNKRKYTNDESVRQSIINEENNVNEFYNNSNENPQLLELLQLTPMMYWCAFRRLIPVGHSQHDPSKDIIEIVTKPLVAKLNKYITQKD